MTDNMGYLSYVLGNPQAEYEMAVEKLAEIDDWSEMEGHRSLLEGIVFRYEEKQRQIAHAGCLTWAALEGDPDPDACESKLFRTFICLGSHELPGIVLPALMRAHDDGSPNAEAVMKHMLPGLWSGINDLMGNGGLSTDEWLEYFRFCGFVSDGPERPVAGGETLLYRGCPVGTEGLTADPAWSSDREAAEWFARRHTQMTGEASCIYMAEIPHEYVLARCDGRGESEWTIDPEAFDTVGALAIDHFVVSEG